MESGVFSKIMKVARLKVIRKTGIKDWIVPLSHRPISLLPTIGKVLERLIAMRIYQHLEGLELFNPLQCAFRLGRGTVEVVR